MPKSSHYLNRFLDNTDRIQFFYWGTYSETGDPYVKVSQTGFDLMLGVVKDRRGNICTLSRLICTHGGGLCCWSKVKALLKATGRRGAAQYARCPSVGGGGNMELVLCPL